MKSLYCLIIALLLSFSTGYALDPPQLLLPESVNEFINCNTFFQWSSVNEANQYQLQVSTHSDFQEYSIDINTVDTSYSGTILIMLTKYYWRVMALNPPDSSSWSSVRSFWTDGSMYLGLDTTHTTAIDENPAVYAHSYQGSKCQMLYRADSLIAHGALPGNIYNIGFDVFQANGIGELSNWTINIKLTTETSLNSWDNDYFDEVYNGTVNPVAGWNTYQLDYPVFWDGVSNILIQICYNDLAIPTTDNALTYYSNTDYNSVIYLNQNDDPSLCSSAQTEITTSTKLPNIYLGFDLYWNSTPLPIFPMQGATNIPLETVLTWHPVPLSAGYNVQVSLTSNFSTLIFNDSVTDAEYTVSLQPGTTYFWRVKAYDFNNNQSFWSTRMKFSTVGFKVSGNLNYNNTDNTPLSGCNLTLKDSIGSIIAQTTTNNSGYYEFPSVLNGTYTVEASTDKAWGGLNIQDVVLTRQKIAFLTTFTPIQNKAADVNMSNSVSIQDVVLMRQKIAFLNPPYWIIPNYVFENPTLTVNGSNIEINFMGLCAGDVNGSFVPPQ